MFHINWISAELLIETVTSLKTTNLILRIKMRRIINGVREHLPTSVPGVNVFNHPLIVVILKRTLEVVVGELVECKGICHATGKIKM